MDTRKQKRTLRLVSLLLMLGGGVGLFFLYFWMYTAVLGYDLPGTVLRRQKNAELTARVGNIGLRLHQQEEILEGLKLRDETIYRSLFDLPSIPDQRRKEGILSEGERYPDLKGADRAGLLRRTALLLDKVEKEAYIQGRSFEEVADIARISGDMASCIPAIPPIIPDPTTYNLSSPFGYRRDPLNGSTRMHKGMDFACKPGNPIFATGDGVVESLTFEHKGYGLSVVIDHGFGYKTRYAHMSIISVAEGMRVRRGDHLGQSGKSGRISGPHLHYEVYYHDQAVNPYNYMDLHMDLDEYRKLVQSRQEDSKAILGTPKKR